MNGTDLSAPPISETHAKEKRIAVVEIFGPVLQGEGPLAGSKTLFVRFGGCDYRCTKCDSLHAVIPAAVKANARYLTADEIHAELMELAKDTGVAWVTFSGGNPLMWDLSKLVSLVHAGSHPLAIAVETQGTLVQPWLARTQMVVISPKSPGMGEKFEPEKLVKVMSLTAANQVPTAIKVVVFSAQDIEFALEVQEVVNSQEFQLLHPGLMFLSLGNSTPPVLDETMHLTENPELVKLALEDNHGERPIDAQRHELLEAFVVATEEIMRDPRIQHWRLLPQLHVLMYGNTSER